MIADARPAPATFRRIIVAVSLLLHLLLVALLLHPPTVSVAPIHMPGSTQGRRMVLTYSPGRALQAPTAVARLRTPRLPIRFRLPQHATPAVKPAPSLSESAASHLPDPQSGMDALGDGDVSIALMEFFPDPKPDLTRLPHGSRGDVVLEAVIDAAGHIAELTIKEGVGYGVDESVIATVTQWTFHPAMREGKPIASQQEFHFHYERG